MEVLKKFVFKTRRGKSKEIFFGTPNNEGELTKMFKLRFEVYSEHGYIDASNYPEEEEKDEYDLNNKSTYIIAVIDKKLVGSVRIIQDDYLPTEKDCFDFEEPKVLEKIPREKRAEPGRLVAKKHKVNSSFLPRHLVLFGLLSTALDIAEEKGVEGGYAFIKSSLDKKLSKLRFPFHHIKDYRVKYRGGPLEFYFQQKNDKVIPVYFLTEEAKGYFEDVLKNSILFKRINHNAYFYKKISKLKLLILSINRLVFS